MPIGPSNESTLLTDEEERRYKKWIYQYKIRDIDPSTDEPYDDVHYDMRGYWKEHTPSDKIAGWGPPVFEDEHKPDTYKQHGHPTFSQESKYSSGPSDGGMWIGENKDIFLKQPRLRRSGQ